MHDFHDGDSLTRSLTYAGFVLLLFEQVKTLIVNPVRAFYSNITFSDSSPFTDYETDVRSRDKNEFEACLLYLRDFMEAIDLADYTVVHSLREHRNDLAHHLADRLDDLEIGRNVGLLREARDVLFKLSNYNVRMEIGADPEAQAVIDDWETVYGDEYSIINRIVAEVGALADLR